MKNNKLLYLLTILITLFSFNIRAYAYNDIQENIGVETNIPEPSIKKINENVSCINPIKVTDPTAENLITLTTSPNNKEYTGVCKYQATSGIDKVIVDVKLADKELLFSEYSTKKGYANSGKDTIDSVGNNYKFEINTEYVYKEFFENFRGSCPPELKGVMHIENYHAKSLSGISDTYNPSDLFVLIKTEGNNPITGEALESASEIQKQEIGLIGEKFATIEKCEDMFQGESGEKLLNLLKFIVNLLKIGIPILLIGLGVIDFVQIIFVGAEDKIKKAQAKFINRLIIGACIYLIPTVIRVFLEIANSVWPNISADFCGIL